MPVPKTISAELNERTSAETDSAPSDFIDSANRMNSSTFSDSSDYMNSSDYTDSSDFTDSPASERSRRVYVSNKDKYEDLSSSGSSLLIVGLILSVLLAIDLSRIIKLPVNSSSRILTDSVLAVIVLFCLGGSHYTFKKANQAKAKIAAEQQKRQQIISWCLSTYTPSFIDKVIEAAESSPVLSMEILSLKRMDMIKSYLLREYPREDEVYLDDLCEEIYQKMFED